MIENPQTIAARNYSFIQRTQILVTELGYTSPLMTILTTW